MYNIYELSEVDVFFIPVYELITRSMANAACKSMKVMGILTRLWLLLNKC